MLDLPSALMGVILRFAPLFSKRVFRHAQVPEYMRLPDARAGAMSVLTGVAARTSIEKKRPVKISELVSL